MALRIHNTLSRSLEEFHPLRAGRVGMYVCGMTIYDLCHMGHLRMMMAFDVVYRWLRTLGYDVTYVRNITDIEDKIIKRALERKITIRELTDEMIAAMRADLGAVGVVAPTHEPRATDYVPQMLGLIGQLETKGLAYRASNGDVNFAVRKFPGYGKLSGKIARRVARRRAGGRARRQGAIRSTSCSGRRPRPTSPQTPSATAPTAPAARAGTSSARPWPAPCSASTFDIHGGGMDLTFPHHENEIAQSEGASGGPFVRYWLHNGFLNVDNQKMSKSLGNFFTIREVLKRYDGETLRFFMLRTHYRSPFNFSDVHLDDARTALRRLYTALDGVAASAGRDRLVAAGGGGFPRRNERRLQHAARAGRAVRPGQRS